MSDLLVPLTFMATIITIASGGITILSFLQQRKVSSLDHVPTPTPVPASAYQPPVFEPSARAATGMTADVSPRPQTPFDDSSWSPYPPASDLPAAIPLERPDYRPSIMPLAHTPSMRQPSRHDRSRFGVGYPKLAVFALLGQITWVVFLVIISIPGPDGTTALWKTNASVDAWSDITFFASAIAIIACAVYALIRAGRLRRWGWFIGVLLGTIVGSFLVAGVASLIFGLWGPTMQTASKRSRG